MEAAKIPVDKMRLKKILINYIKVKPEKLYKFHMASAYRVRNFDFSFSAPIKNMLLRRINENSQNPELLVIKPACNNMESLRCFE